MVLLLVATPNGAVLRLPDLRLNASKTESGLELATIYSCAECWEPADSPIATVPPLASESAGGSALSKACFGLGPRRLV